MALTASRELDHFVDQQLRTFKVAASKTIHKGAFLGLDSNGYVQPLVAGNSCAGIAYEAMDNSGGSNGDKSVRSYTIGDFLHALAGVAQSKIGDAVFASDDGTLTLTAAGNSFVGKCVDIPASGEIILRLQTLAKTSPVYAVTNGTPDRAYDADTVAVAELADVVGTLIGDLQAKQVIG